MSGFVCPVCGGALTRAQGSLCCEARHCFDFAKSGYVNLLLSSQMHAKLPGDNQQMVQARHAFLQKGYYAPMMEALCKLAVKERPNGAVLDIGCGEGYYTCHVMDALQGAFGEHPMLGIDISKHALKLAAKACNGAELAVASAFHLPVAEQSCGLLLNLFAPFCLSECVRVLKPGGRLILVIPAKRHLWELKQTLYDEPYENEVKSYALEGFSLLEKAEVCEQIRLESQTDIQQLFSMTPYYYKTSAAGQALLAARDTLETQIAFELLEYRKG